jgi:hypothetical protein
VALTVDDTGEYVNHGSGSSVDNVYTGTALAWFWFDTLPATSGHPQRILSKGNGWAFGTAGSNNFICFVDAATDVTIFAPFANFAAGVTTGKWMFLAWTFKTANAGGVTGDQNLYFGDLAAAAASPSGYTLRNAGAGAEADNSAKDLYAGNNPDATTECLEGRLGVTALFNRVLTLAEVQAWQWKPRVESGCLLYSHYGWNGVGTQVDWSGNANNGTVGGSPAVADHVPLGPAFGYDVLAPYAPVTAVDDSVTMGFFSPGIGW